MPGHDEKADHFSCGQKEPENAGSIFGQALALQLLFREVSESMGNHDSKIVDAGSVD